MQITLITGTYVGVIRRLCEMTCSFHFIYSLINKSIWEKVREYKCVLKALYHTISKAIIMTELETSHIEEIIDERAEAQQEILILVHRIIHTQIFQDLSTLLNESQIKFLIFATII